MTKQELLKYIDEHLPGGDYHVVKCYVTVMANGNIDASFSVERVEPSDPPPLIVESKA